MWPGIVMQWTQPWALPSLAAWPWPRGCRLWLLSPCPDTGRVRWGWGSDVGGFEGLRNSCEAQAGASSRESSESTCWRQKSWPRRTTS